MLLSREVLLKKGFSTGTVNAIFAIIEQNPSPVNIWQQITKTISTYPFDLQLFIFNQLFPTWQQHPELAPAVIPDNTTRENANIYQFMKQLGFQTVEAFHAWSVHNYEDFWQRVIHQLKIKFKKIPLRICDLTKGIVEPQWLAGAKFNIADSCFLATDGATALVCQVNDKLISYSYAELNSLSNQVANGLAAQGFKAGDAIGIVMPMTMEAVAIYLGIIKLGAMVVSIADSFSSQEISLRLNIAKTKAVFTQDYLFWNQKQIPLYEKIVAANAPIIIVLSCNSAELTSIRSQDLAWQNFLAANREFESAACDPMAACNILFSSGTTGNPKAIIWNHTTPIKVASDAYFHQNIKAGDILAWPTNLGWMMGPWLVFAALINKACIALYPEAPKDRAFGEFVQNAKVTMLGVVPTLVNTWRQTKCMEQLDFSNIKVFSSTGECSNPEDMLYLMSLANYKPVIEYCGGTEIGGAYITSTVIQNNYPSLFSTPAMGIDFVLIDEAGHISNEGEVAIIPPSIGLSTQLLNSDHYNVYYANMPHIDNKILRRHGDQARRLINGYYILLGRTDDTMNLGGIKISAAEIERVIAAEDAILETAAIAFSENSGPSQLIIFAVTAENNIDKTSIINNMQKRINKELNPLFKIHDIIFIKELPKTASNKIMRRILRDKLRRMG